MKDALVAETEALWRSHVVAQHPSTTERKHKGGVWVEVVVCRVCERAFIAHVGRMPGARAAVQRGIRRMRR